MSQDHAQTLRLLIERWNSGDRNFHDLPEYLTPAFEMESPLSAVGGEPYSGYAGIERWVGDLDDQFAEWNIDVDDIREIGHRVLTIATITARGRASEVSLQFASASVCDFARDHRIARMRIYADVEDAFKAVGLAGEPVSANLELVRSIYADWERGDFSLIDRESGGWRDTFEPDFEWHTRNDLPDAGVRKGYQGAARLRAEWVEAFDDFHVELDELIGAGERVIAVTRLCGCLRDSGRELALRETQVWKIQDGRAVEVRAYLTRSEALQSVGRDG